jgi:hypothetical protein
VINISTSIISPSPTTVHYTISGSAILGQDYTLTGTPGVVVIPAGQRSTTVGFTATVDNVVEKREVAVFTLAERTKGRKSAKIFIKKQKPAKSHR